MNARIRKCRFNDLRHTFATDLVLGGVDLVTGKELMGHADISVTMGYAHPTPESKRKAVELLMKTDQVADAVADEDKVAQAVNAQAVEKKMELVIGVEPMTYALRMRTKINKKMIDTHVVTEVVVTCETFALSNQFPFVSGRPNIPDL